MYWENYLLSTEHKIRDSGRNLQIIVITAYISGKLSMRRIIYSIFRERMKKEKRAWVISPAKLPEANDVTGAGEWIRTSTLRITRTKPSYDFVV